MTSDEKKYKIKVLSQACHYLTNTHHKHMLAAFRRGSYGGTVDTLSSKSTDAGDRRLGQKRVHGTGVTCYNCEASPRPGWSVSNVNDLRCDRLHTDICDLDELPTNVFNPGCADEAGRFAAVDLEAVSS